MLDRARTNENALLHLIVHLLGIKRCMHIYFENRA